MIFPPDNIKEIDTIFLTNEWYRLGRFRHFLRDGQHEDREGEQDGDPEADLLSRVRWQAEHQDRQGAHHHAREHNVVPGKGQDQRCSHYKSISISGRCHYRDHKFFVVLACRWAELDGFDKYFQATVHFPLTSIID